MSHYTLIKVNGDVLQFTAEKDEDVNVKKLMSCDDIEINTRFAMNINGRECKGTYYLEDNVSRYIENYNELFSTMLNASKNKYNKDYKKYWSSIKIYGNVLIKTKNELNGVYDVLKDLAINKFKTFVNALEKNEIDMDDHCDTICDMMEMLKMMDE